MENKSKAEMKVDRQRTLPRLATEEEVEEMRAQVDDLSFLMEDEVICGILVCRLKLNRSLSRRAGKNSTSGPQPYQPYEGGDYLFPTLFVVFNLFYPYNRRYL